MKYAVLGGGGSFGIHLSKFLLEKNDTERVIGIGRSPLRDEPFSLKVGHRVVVPGDGISRIEITKPDDRYSYHTFHVTHEHDLLMRFLDKEQPETIVNFAAQGEGAVSWSDSWRFFETNCVGLAKLTEQLQKRNYLRRFIHIGTSELYGSCDHPAKESDPFKPTSPYAASKAAFDMHLLAIGQSLNFPMNIIRPSNAYGPGQLLHRIIPKTVVSLLKGMRVPLHGGGRAEKSYIHSRDLANAIHIVSERAPLGTVYNVGPDNPVSIRAVVETICEAMCVPFDKAVDIVEDRLGQDSRYWLDSSEVRKLGWEPKISLSEGVKDVIRWGEKYFNELIPVSMDYQLRA